MSLEGKIALVTGAASGVGRAVTLALAKQGCDIVTVDRNAKELEILDDEVRSLGAKTIIVPADLSKHALIDQLASPLFERYGKLDIFVGCAAILGVLTLLPQVPPDIFEQTYNVNVIANWRLLRALDPLLRQAQHPRALFLTAADKVTSGNWAYWGLYTSTKAALESMILCYAKEITHPDYKVNLVDPGYVMTPMLLQAFPGIDERETNSPEMIAANMMPFLQSDFQRHGEILKIR